MGSFVPAKLLPQMADVADVVLINPREIYLLGKKSGHTNLLVWTAQGSTTLRDISVGADTDSLHAKLREYVPSAENLRVDSVADTLVLSRVHSPRLRTRLSVAISAQRPTTLTQQAMRALIGQLAARVLGYHALADQLMAHDALGAHTRDELGISATLTAKPLQAALASAASFVVGAALPLAVTFVAPEHSVVPWISGMSLVFLGSLGAIAAKAGGASIMTGAWRVTFWGALAMGVTALVGHLFGAVV